MKKILLVCSLLVMGMSAQAQVMVNDTDINTLPDVQYIELLGVEAGLFTKKVVVIVDYGQKVAFGDAQTIKGADGKTMKFMGMLDALNFMVKNGWEYTSQYVISGNNQNVYHYLLHRKP